MGFSPGKCAALGPSFRPAEDSVANVSQIVTIDKQLLGERVGKLSRSKLELMLSGIDIVLGR